MKKYISSLILSLFFSIAITGNSQEGIKLPLSNGTLKICSTKNFIIKGYDGNEIIIKNIYKDRYNVLVDSLYAVSNKNKNSVGYVSEKKGSGKLYNRASYPIVRGSERKSEYAYVGFFPNGKHSQRSKGLKKLGKKAEAEESGIYLKIEKKDGEIVIKDDIENSFIMTHGEKYEITIPNSISLKWDTSGCEKNRSIYFGGNQSEISNFKGEVEIRSSLNSFKLSDVTGPVSVNTIGGNVTVEFNNTTPNKLYSIYSNNGFIDISLPKSASILVDAIASEILSDLDFKILSEDTNELNQKMNLKLGSGKVKMKLDADLGRIYLRENK